MHSLHMQIMTCACRPQNRVQHSLLPNLWRPRQNDGVAEAADLAWASGTEDAAGVAEPI